jgi:hypothetical protein
MELFRVPMYGSPVRAEPDPELPVDGMLGLDVTGGVVEDAPRTVVQLLLDDDAAGFDRSLLDAPIVAELVDGLGRVVAAEPFDHDGFRRRLDEERRSGESVTRGVLVLTEGRLPPPWVRLAFLPFPLDATAGNELRIRRTSVEELVQGVELAYSNGAISDTERTALLVSVEQLHP